MAADSFLQHAVFFQRFPDAAIGRDIDIAFQHGEIEPVLQARRLQAFRAFERQRVKIVLDSHLFGIFGEIDRNGGLEKLFRQTAALFEHRLQDEFF